MKITFCLGLFIIGMMPCVARADMYAALQSVYDSNPVISESRAAVDGANADLDLARTGSRPYLGVNANAGLARSKVFDQTFDTTPTEFGATFQQNIFQGFSTIAKIKGAKSNLAASTASLYATQQSVFLDAINAYINVLNAQEVMDLSKNNQRVLQQYYDQCVARQQVGALTSTDVAQASARLESAKYQTNNARAEYDNAIETFKRIYGKDEKKYTDISLARVQHLFPASVDSAEEYAIKHHPVLVALAAQEAAARESITVARASRLPSVDVKASAMQINDIPIADKLRDGRVGVYVSLPLYDRGTASANVDKVRSTVAGIQNRAIDMRRIIIEQLHQAWNTYDAQTYAITAANATVDANKLALDGTRAEQSRGRRTVLDVLNAEQELLNSRVALARARHGQVAAYFAVLAAMGQLSAENLGVVVADTDE
ncbi:TolC family outer membrane protein [bacterium]|nr:TolC family outer membrane protein [bacterium]